MFEALAERARRRAAERAETRRRSLAERLAEMLPNGVRVEESDQGIGLEGRGLRRRFALDASLRWLLQGLLQGLAR